MGPDVDMTDDDELRHVLLAVAREHSDAIAQARRLVALGQGPVALSRALVAFDDALRRDVWGMT